MITIGIARLRRMPPWDDRERATVLALLQELPQAASWPEVAAEIIEAGSAWSVWDAHHEQSLFDAETPAPVAEAARQIAGWRAAGLGVHTFRDVSYPAQLREIHQVPPVLSQFWPDAPATKKAFPLRNATISGYGRATIVFEAGRPAVRGRCGTGRACTSYPAWTRRWASSPRCVPILMTS